MTTQNEGAGLVERLRERISILTSKEIDGTATLGELADLDYFSQAADRIEALEAAQASRAGSAEASAMREASAKVADAEVAFWNDASAEGAAKVIAENIRKLPLPIPRPATEPTSEEVEAAAQAIMCIRQEENPRSDLYDWIKEEAMKRHGDEARAALKAAMQAKEER